MKTIAKFCKGRYKPLEICAAGCQRYFEEFIKSKRDSTTRRVILSNPPPAPQLYLDDDEYTRPECFDAGHGEKES